MTIMKDIKKLCKPAYVYLVISVLSVVLMMIQNGGNENMFCLGNYECDVKHTGAIFIGQVIYTVFWVFLLDWLCKSGHKTISWFLVLLPYLFLFIGLGMVMIHGNSKKKKKDEKTVREGLRNRRRYRRGRR